MKTSLLSLLSLFLFAFTCTGDKKENLESQANQAIDEVVGNSAPNSSNDTEHCTIQNYLSRGLSLHQSKMCEQSSSSTP